jgi:putative phosphoribosyl transferase
MFKNREEAGKKLAKLMAHYRGPGWDRKCVVIGLARGGVVVAAEVAKFLKMELGVIIPRKVGAPGNLELAIGAVMDDGRGYLNQALIQELGVSKEYLKDAIAKARNMSAERKKMYGKAAEIELAGKTVILVDDGIATGATMYAAIQYVKEHKAAEVVVAIPVASISALYTLKSMADDVICVDTEDLGAISMSYENFAQVEDKDVIALLAKSHYS